MALLQMSVLRLIVWRGAQKASRRADVSRMHEVIGLLGSNIVLLVLFDAHGTSGGRGGHSVTNDNANAASVSIISGYRNISSSLL